MLSRACRQSQDERKKIGQGTEGPRGGRQQERFQHLTRHFTTFNRAESVFFAPAGWSGSTIKSRIAADQGIKTSKIKRGI